MSTKTKAYAVFAALAVMLVTGYLAEAAGVGATAQKVFGTIAVTILIALAGGGVYWFATSRPSNKL